MNKYIIFVVSIFLVVGFVSFNSGVLANGDDDHSIAAEEEITTADLGIEDPGLLPSSPFYFFKQWRRGIQKAFTFNPVAKAELELRFANEQAAEIKELEETEPENIDAIKKAFGNYQKSHERLRERLEALKETSDNPNVDRLLEKLTERIVKHEKLFDNLAHKFEDSAEVRNAINKAREKLEESFVEASRKDRPEKLASRLEKILERERGGELKDLRSVEILDRLHDQLPEEVRDQISRIRDNFSAKFEEKLKAFAENRDPETIQKFIERIPGDKSHRAIILEELRERAGEELAEKLRRTRESLEGERPTIVPKPGEVICTQEFNPVCGANGKTYSNQCFARVRGVEVRYRGECREDEPRSVETPKLLRTPLSSPSLTKTPTLPRLIDDAVNQISDIIKPKTISFRVEADDNGFYPNSILSVTEGSIVEIIFYVRERNVYFNGLDFRSPKFKTSSVKPGNSVTVKFTADKSFEFSSYWPASNRLKATGKVVVK